MTTIRRLILATAACALVAPAAHAQQPMTPPVTPTLDEPIRVPMSHESRHIIVEATINGDGPHLFILDTGAGGGGRLNPELAERLGVPITGSVRVSDGTGRGGGERPICTIDSLVIGGAEWRDVAVLHDAGISRAAHEQPVQGILGFALFHDLLLTIDYPNSELVIAEGALEAGEHTAAFDAQRGVPTVDLAVGDATIPANIDTGSMGTIVVPASALEHVETAGPPIATGVARTSFNTFFIKEARLAADAELAGHTLERPVVAFAESFRSGHLGYGALHNFRLTFDQQSGLVRFEKPTPGPVTFEGRRGTGLLIAPAPDRLEVAAVAPGSSAEAAGLAAGDLLVAIDGEPVSPGEFLTIRERLDGESVSLTVERDGDRITVELTRGVLIE